MDIVISSIEKQKNNDSRFSVFIDSEFAFGMSGADLLHYKLEPGMELSREEYDYILSETVFINAKKKAVRLLTLMPRSRKELSERLSNDGYPLEIVEKVIKLMEEWGLIDDYKYAESFIRDKSERFGSKRIRYELKRKGVDDECVQAAYDDLDIDEASIASDLLRKKYREYIPGEEKGKAYHYLLRKGFDYEIIYKVIKEYSNNCTE